MIRLDKYLADMQAGTRSQVKEYIRKGRVKVNGTVVKCPESKIDVKADEVLLDGCAVRYLEYEYYMLNKPAGVLSASAAPNAVTVVDLIRDRKRNDLFPVGRLDKDAEGLLLLTNDGVMSHRLLAPKNHVEKKYFVCVRGVYTDGIAQAFRKGLRINISKCADEEVKSCEPVWYDTLPAALEPVTLGTDWFEGIVTIHEGKFHQIKRMFLAAGCQVVYLKRISFGKLCLDEGLQTGAYRRLRSDEVDMLRCES